VYPASPLLPSTPALSFPFACQPNSNRRLLSYAQILALQAWHIAVAKILISMITGLSHSLQSRISSTNLMNKAFKVLLNKIKFY
jgi:hypothetical protein